MKFLDETLLALRDVLPAGSVEDRASLLSTLREVSPYAYFLAPPSLRADREVLSRRRRCGLCSSTCPLPSPTTRRW